MNDYPQSVPEYFDYLFETEYLPSLEVAALRISDETGLPYRAVKEDLEWYRNILEGYAKILGSRKSHHLK